MNEMTLPGLGHNHPPGPFIPEALAAKVEDFTGAATAWLNLKEITSADQSQKATDFVNGAKGVWNEIEAERKAQKKPHDDAAKAVQDLFAPVLGKVKIAQERVGTMQTKWMQAERARQEAIRREEEAAARKAQEAAAAELAAAEARNDVSAIADAEEAAKAAAKEVKAAAAPVKVQAQSATGAGRTISLRTTYYAEVANINHAFVAYREHPKVRELLESLATADVRSQQGEKVAPNGFTLRKEEKAA